jgi:hypothetical protein
MAYFFGASLERDVYIKVFERSEGEVLPWYVIAQAESYSQQELARLPNIARVGVFDRSAPFALPSVLGKSAAGCLFFSEEVRDVLVELEPGVHDFAPVELRLFPKPPDKDDRALAVYYMWHSPPTVEAIIPELTEYAQGFGPAARVESQGRLSLGETSPCVIRGPLVNGRHCWREIYSVTKIDSGGVEVVENSFGFFCSAEFYSRVKFFRFTGFNFYKWCDVVG